MKNSKWILIVSAVSLFSAQQIHRSGSDMPDFSRNPAMVSSKTTAKRRVAHAKANPTFCAFKKNAEPSCAR